MLFCCPSEPKNIAVWGCVEKSRKRREMWAAETRILDFAPIVKLQRNSGRKGKTVNAARRLLIEWSYEIEIERPVSSLKKATVSILFVLLIDKKFPVNQRQKRLLLQFHDCFRPGCFPLTTFLFSLFVNEFAT